MRNRIISSFLAALLLVGSVTATPNGSSKIDVFVPVRVKEKIVIEKMSVMVSGSSPECFFGGIVKPNAGLGKRLFKGDPNRNLIVDSGVKMAGFQTGAKKAPDQTDIYVTTLTIDFSQARKEYQTREFLDIVVKCHQKTLSHGPYLIKVVVKGLENGPEDFEVMSGSNGR